MGPARKSRSVNRRYANEVSPSKDGDSAKRSNTRKRKLCDMLGPRWGTEELTRFYEAYRKYGADWKKVAGAVRNRSSEMAEALYTMNRAYLSLPHGTASSAGLIAMMTDHYSNLAGSDSDEESNDGAGSSRKTQKRARGKVQPTTSKASDSQLVLQSQSAASDYGCLSLLKKKRSGGSQPCPVGKRTPRFPVSFSYENMNGEKYVSPTRQGLKLKANANDDEVAHEIAIALAEASQIGGSPLVSRTSSKRVESVMSSPFRHGQRKSLAEMANTKISAGNMDEEDLEGGTEADTGELSKYKHPMMESTSIGTVREKGRKLQGKKFEIDNDSENHLDDIKEECSGTEEGQRFGAMKGKLDVEVTEANISRSSIPSQRKKSKKVLFTRDEAPAFDALQTLADLSLMMPTENEDGFYMDRAAIAVKACEMQKAAFQARKEKSQAPALPKGQPDIEKTESPIQAPPLAMATLELEVDSQEPRGKPTAPTGETEVEVEEEVDDCPLRIWRSCENGKAIEGTLDSLVAEAANEPMAASIDEGQAERHKKCYHDRLGVSDSNLSRVDPKVLNSLRLLSSEFEASRLQLLEERDGIDRLRLELDSSLKGSLGGRTYDQYNHCLFDADQALLSGMSLIKIEEQYAQFQLQAMAFHRQTLLRTQHLHRKSIDLERKLKESEMALQKSRADFTMLDESCRKQSEMVSQLHTERDKLFASKANMEKDLFQKIADAERKADSFYNKGREEGRAEGVIDFKNSEEFSLMLRDARHGGVRDFCKSGSFFHLLNMRAATFEFEGFNKVIGQLEKLDGLKQNFDLEKLDPGKDANYEDIFPSSDSVVASIPDEFGFVMNFDLAADDGSAPAS